MEDSILDILKQGEVKQITFFAPNYAAKFKIKLKNSDFKIGAMMWILPPNEKREIFGESGK